MRTRVKEKIERARELLATSRHVSIATVNEDGSPHNSPVRFLYDPKLTHIYWDSHPDSMHSKNVVRTGKIFAALYDRNERGGLYMQGERAHELSGRELEKALKVHNAFRVKEKAEPLPLSYYTGESPQRMWGAEIARLWVNYAERGADGHLLKDVRIAITAQELLK